MSCISLFLAFSMHVGLQNDYNGVHPHARCSLDNFMFGTYYNSEENISHYVGKDFGGLEIGLVTGYAYDVVPMIRYKKGEWFIAPAYEVDGNLGLTFGLEIEL